MNRNSERNISGFERRVVGWVRFSPVLLLLNDPYHVAIHLTYNGDFWLTNGHDTDEDSVALSDENEAEDLRLFREHNLVPVIVERDADNVLRVIFEFDENVLDEREKELER